MTTTDHGTRTHQQPAAPAAPAEPAGSVGPNGSTGPTRPMGPAGPAGPTGPTGPIRPMGPAGPAGPNGSAPAADTPVGGPVPMPWREGTLTRAKELECLAYGLDRADGSVLQVH